MLTTTPQEVQLVKERHVLHYLLHYWQVSFLLSKNPGLQTQRFPFKIQLLLSSQTQSLAGGLLSTKCY